MSSEQGTFSRFWENGERFFLDGVLGGLVDDDEERGELLNGDTPRQEKGSKPMKKEAMSIGNKIRLGPNEIK